MRVRRGIAAALAGAAGATLVAASPAHAVSARQAAQTLREQWPGVAARDVQIGGPAAGLPVERYVSDTVAQLPGAQGRLLISSRPLRATGPDGALQPVDLTLRDTGAAHAPVAAPFVLAIADDPAGGFRIGPDAASAVTVRPAAAGDGGDPVRMLDGKPFFANTRRDADTLLAPVAEGLETFDQLRTAAAPEALSYRLELADGQRARLRDGMVVVTSGGAEVVRVSPPVARDAAGRDVPAELRLARDVVTIAVRHRHRGFAYPIMVDPTWSSIYDFRGGGPTGNEGLYVEESPGGPWYEMFAYEDAAAGGFWIRPFGGKVYPEGVSGQISFIAPGTTRIASAHWRHVSHLNDRHRQTLRLALYGGTAPQVFDHWDVGAGFADQDIVQDDPTDSATIAQMRLMTPPCTPGEADCPRAIPSPNDTFASVGALDVTLIDDDFPTTDASGPLRDLAETWTNSTAWHSVTMAAHDGGAGVLDYQLIVTDAAGDHPLAPQATACDGEHNTPGQGRNICPADHAVAVGFPVGDLPNGQATFTVAARDLAGNTSDAGGGSASWRTFVDRTRPAIGATGQLTEQPGWTRARGDLSVRLRADDSYSGVQSYELWAFDGKDRELLHDAIGACTPAGPITAPCPGAHASTTTIDGDALPDGPVRFRARSTDYTGNRSDDLEWTVRLDRREPVARATGELTRLEGSGWSDAERDIPVQVSARDIGSGVSRIALVATNSAGRRMLASADVCALDNTTADPCPAEATATLMIDAGDLPDGRTSFEVVATDQAGNVSQNGTDWDTYFDHTAPDAPAVVTVRPRDESSVEISWDRAADTGGSGIAGYEYQLRVEGQPATRWETTTIPMAKLGGLPPGVKVEVLVRALDRAANPSRVTRGSGASKKRRPRARAASTKTQKEIAEEIWREQGLRELERYANTGQRVGRQLGRTILVGALKGVGKVAARVSIVATVVEFFLGEGDLDCEASPFNRKARNRFVPAGNVLDAVAGASQARHPVLTDRVRDSKRALLEFRKEAKRLADAVPKRCKPYYETALHVIDRTVPALDAAAGTLHDLEVLARRKYAREKAEEINRKRTKTGTVRCREAVDGDGPGKANFYVYWSPPAPPPEAVRYVGISRALKTRCRKHIERIRDHLFTLRLPFLRYVEARGVEEALIAHFGPAKETSNSGKAKGQLFNDKHSTDPSRDVYCERLLLGQFILLTNGYGRYAAAYFTRGKDCPGTG